MYTLRFTIRSSQCRWFWHPEIHIHNIYIYEYDICKHVNSHNIVFIWIYLERFGESGMSTNVFRITISVVTTVCNSRCLTWKDSFYLNNLYNIYTTWKGSMAIATPISLGLSGPLQIATFWEWLAIYFHVRVYTFKQFDTTFRILVTSSCFMMFYALHKTSIYSLRVMVQGLWLSECSRHARGRQYIGRCRNYVGCN